MKNLFRLPVLALLTLIVLINGCKKEEIITFIASEGIINADDYTWGGELTFMFSNDGGSSWSASLDDIEEGSTIQVKLYNGTADLTSEFFTFDWSGSSLQPENINSDIASFILSDDLTVAVKVSDIINLVMVKRSSGELFSVDRANGNMTLEGTIRVDGANALTNLRGLVYDYETEFCYSSATNNGDGMIYKVDIASGQATLINDNSDWDWDAIADLVIKSNGGLIGIGYSNLYYNSAIIEVNKVSGEDGTHHSLMDASEEEYWSPGAITYGNSQDEYIVGGENEIYFTNASAVISSVVSLVSSENIDVVSNSIYVMDMEKDKDGTIYAQVYDRDNSIQYFVSIDAATGTISELSVLSENGVSNGYHCLSLIPKYKIFTAVG